MIHFRYHWKITLKKRQRKRKNKRELVAMLGAEWAEINFHDTGNGTFVLLDNLGSHILYLAGHHECKNMHCELRVAALDSSKLAGLGLTFV